MLRRSLSQLKNQNNRLFRMASSNDASEPSESSWVSRLSIREMKEIVRGMPEEKSCFERADLEKLVASKFQSMEEYKSSRNGEPATFTNPDSLEALKTRIQTVLSQDRGALNFEHYTPGREHQERMKKLAKLAPEVYDNPDITPRSQWFRHPRYRQNSQMPPYHVHFRDEMQDVLRYLYQAYTAQDSSHQWQQLRHAVSIFHGSMRGLSGHVSIEEYACFPVYQRLYPHVDIRFLYTDHKDLHRAEQGASKALTRLVEIQKIATISREQILETLKVLLDFDDHLMAHLGEEEEIVVPMSLTEKTIHF